ncbi:hypothetical protein BDZ45DRAFT_733797 [Acephala macrosclerotiorum]|nr:hypothetical protein BDZ45DRAFT_733797 [Acephala macrosclerotiorum]
MQQRSSLSDCREGPETNGKHIDQPGGLFTSCQGQEGNEMRGRSRGKAGQVQYNGAGLSEDLWTPQLTTGQGPSLTAVGQQSHARVPAREMQVGYVRDGGVKYAGDGASKGYAPRKTALKSPGRETLRTPSAAKHKGEVTKARRECARRSWARSQERYLRAQLYRFLGDELKATAEFLSSYDLRSVAELKEYKPRSKDKCQMIEYLISYDSVYCL